MKRGNAETVGQLVTAQRVALTDGVGLQALHRACALGHLEVVKLLVAEGAKVDAEDSCPNRLQPIHWASSYGRLEIVTLLVAKGAKADATNKDGWQPLHYACREGHLGVVKLLVARGATVDALTSDGDSPMFWARHRQHTDVVEWLEANVEDTASLSHCLGPGSEEFREEYRNLREAQRASASASEESGDTTKKRDEDDL